MTLWIYFICQTHPSKSVGGANENLDWVTLLTALVWSLPNIHIKVILQNGVDLQVYAEAEPAEPNKAQLALHQSSIIYQFLTLLDVQSLSLVISFLALSVHINEVRSLWRFSFIHDILRQSKLG